MVCTGTPEKNKRKNKSTKKERKKNTKKTTKRKERKTKQTCAEGAGRVPRDKVAVCWYDQSCDDQSCDAFS